MMQVSLSIQAGRILPSMLLQKLGVYSRAMKNRDTKGSELCEELSGITRATLYRYVSPDGKLREHGKRVLQR